MNPILASGANPRTVPSESKRPRLIHVPPCWPGSRCSPGSKTIIVLADGEPAGRRIFLPLATKRALAC